MGIAAYRLGRLTSLGGALYFTSKHDEDDIDFEDENANYDDFIYE
jgi:hypothetical protein